MFGMSTCLLHKWYNVDRRAHALAFGEFPMQLPLHGLKDSSLHRRALHSYLLTSQIHPVVQWIQNPGTSMLGQV